MFYKIFAVNNSEIVRIFFQESICGAKIFSPSDRHHFQSVFKVKYIQYKLYYTFIFGLLAFKNE